MNVQRINRRSPLLIAAIGVLALFALDRLLLSTVLASWRDRQEQIATLQARLAQGDNLLDQETRWLRWREETGQRLLPENRSSAENQMLALVDGWARDGGLQVTALRPGWKQTDSKEPLFELQLTGSGGIASITRFLYAAETASSAVAIEQLELSAQNQDGRELGVNMRLTGLCQGNVAASRRRR